MDDKNLYPKAVFIRDLLVFNADQFLAPPDSPPVI
jgi:hypothetical protein